MLGKLLKYEFKATARKFVPIYIAIILMSLINSFLVNTTFLDYPSLGVSVLEIIGNIINFILGGLFIALIVLTIVITIERFNKNLLGDEGYLMFTLPVSSKMLILSKFIVTAVWGVLSFIVGILAIGINVLIGLIKMGEIKTAIEEIPSVLGDEVLLNRLGDFLPAFGAIFTSILLTVLIIYLSITIAHLPKFTKHKTAVGFIVFFILNIIVVQIVNLIASQIGTINILSNNLIWIYIIDVVASIILFFVTSYILDKKLNLE